MQQTLVLVSRGVTDRTPVLVWPWEVPVLEVIHGEGNVIECDHEETLEFMERTQVHVLTPPHLSDGDQLRNNIKGPADFNPANDVAQEYERLIGKYGMHTEIKVPNVEYVYGRLGAPGKPFERAVMAHCAPTRIAKPIAENGQRKLSGAEIREELDRLEIEYNPSAKVGDLRQLLQDHIESAKGDAQED